MRAKLIYEKFTEDSDPISDMNIGVINKPVDFESYDEMHEFLLKIVHKILNLPDSEDLEIAYKQILNNYGGGIINQDCFQSIKNYIQRYFTINKERVYLLHVPEFRMKVQQKLLRIKNKRKKIEKSINEKFIQDSDPVKDMGIGMDAAIDDYLKTYFSHYEYQSLIDKLCILIKMEHLKFITYLLDVNNVDINEYINYAIAYDKLKVVKLFVNKDKNVLKSELIHRAIIYGRGRSVILKYIIEQLEKNHINKQSELNDSLYYATMWNYKKCVKILLEAGAQITSETRQLLIRKQRSKSRKNIELINIFKKYLNA